jgi:hypothetical protein
MQNGVQKAFLESYRHFWQNCLQNPTNRANSLLINNLISSLSEPENVNNWLQILDLINNKMDSFESQFKQSSFRLTVIFIEGSQQKHAFEFQNLRNCNLQEMGAIITIWQQENIFLNPLVNFNSKYDYDKPLPLIPIPPIKKLSPIQIEKQKIEFSKNSNSRKANKDMGTKNLMAVRVQKVFNIFFVNKDLFLNNITKRYYDKTRDSYSDSTLKYENAHDYIFEAIKELKKDWCEFLGNQSARTFSEAQRAQINAIFWNTVTPNFVSIKLLSNKDMDCAIALFHSFLGIRSSLNFPHAQCKHLPKNDFFVTLKTRGILACYIKKASDWAPNNSVILKNGGLTEIATSAVFQLAHESQVKDSVIKEDFAYLDKLLTNRNCTSSHLINVSNGVFHNSTIFNIKFKDQNKKHIPESLVSKSVFDLAKEKKQDSC